MRATGTKRRENGTRRAGARNESELLFEDYLKQQDVEFHFQPPVPDKVKRPDYHVIWKGTEFIAEVKELRARGSRQDGPAWIDPYVGIRKKIHVACRQFREYKDAPCVLVLYNIDDWEFHDWPGFLLGAMLGDLGMQMPFDGQRGELLIDQSPVAFPDRGKVVKRKRCVIENTTISAIAIIAGFEVPNPAYEAEYRSRTEACRRELGRELSFEDNFGVLADLHLRDKVRPTLGEVLQLKVAENPHARLPLSRNVLNGAYDERHAINRRTGKIERVLAGEGLVASERATAASVDLPRKLDRFVRSIVGMFEPVRIVLFGSQASGRAGSDSDVDLLVILPGDGDQAERALDIRRRLPVEFPLDLLTYSAGEIERRRTRGDSFIRQILDEGLTLYCHEDGNSVVD